VARDRVQGVVTACTHMGQGRRRRRFYVFAVVGVDPEDPSSWSEGTVYALPRSGFRREWGNEWVSPAAVRPELRVHVRPEDFPLRRAVVGLTPPLGFRSAIRSLRAAKRDGGASA
jgi:hypothetical protein